MTPLMEKYIELLKAHLLAKDEVVAEEIACQLDAIWYQMGGEEMNAVRKEIAELKGLQDE